MRGSVTVTGMGEVKAALAAAGHRIHDAADQAAEDAAEATADEMRERVAVLTGEAREGIEVVKVGEGMYEVRTGSDHDSELEFGTSDTAAQPFATPAAESQRTQFPKNAASTIGRAAG